MIEIEGTLPLIVFKEEGIWYALCPVLDITGYGNTEAEAKDSFDVMVREFFRYAVENERVTHQPIPEHIVKQCLNALGVTRREFEKSLLEL